MPDLYGGNGVQAALQPIAQAFVAAYDVIADNVQAGIGALYEYHPDTRRDDLFADDFVQPAGTD